jgi:hypothetical protein
LMTRFKTSIVNITERLRLLTPSPICAEKWCMRFGGSYSMMNLWRPI